MMPVVLTAATLQVAAMEPRTDLSPEDEGYEECDDANISNIDDCLNNCLAASCGDGFRAEAEPCDDGNDDPTDFCNDCVLPECGDGHIQPSNNETCDDTNEVDNDACSNECRSAECGDGILRVDLQPDEDGCEFCDDGNQDDTDECVTGCVLAACGDGLSGLGEKPVTMSQRRGVAKTADR